MATAELDGKIGAVTAEDISLRIDRLPFLPFHLRIASILGTGTMFDAFDSLSMATALTMIVASFHLDFRTSGTLLSAAFGGQFIGAILFGWVSEHIGRKWAFVVALGMFGLCSIATAIATSVHAIVIARVVQGIGLGAEVPVAAALFTEFVRASARGMFIMVYETMFAWGIFLAPVVALSCITLFGPALGWRAQFAIGGIPFLVAVVAIFALPESARWLAAKGRLGEADATVHRMEDEARRLGKPLFPAQPLTVKRERTRFAELFQGIYAKRTFVVWSLWFSSYFVSQGFQSWAPTLYMRIGGLPASRAIMLSILGGVITLVSCYIVAATIDRLGRVWWFAIGFGFAAAGNILGLIFTGPMGLHGWPVLLLAGSVMTVGSAVTGGCVYVYTPELYPTRMRAWATATGSSLNRIGAFTAPSLVGFILARWNAIDLVFAMLMAVALYGVLVILVWGEETKRRPLEDLAP